jgi:hypothetical protein
MNARKKNTLRKQEPLKINQAPLIKVKGPEKFILSSELEARYEAALYGWDYQSILAAKALERLASSDVGECMAAIDAARDSFRTDLSELSGRKASATPKSNSTSADGLAWIGMNVWLHVVHTFKSSIGNALMDALQASGQSRSKKGKLVKHRLQDAVNYLLSPLNVVERPRRHGNALLVKMPGKPDAYIPFVAAAISAFLDGARAKGRYLRREELKTMLASKYNDRTFQKIDSGKSTEGILKATKISTMPARTWTKVLSEAGLTFTRPKSSWLYVNPQESK